MKTICSRWLSRRRRTTDKPVGSMVDFEIMGELGRGSYGTVYKARNMETDETVAIKMSNSKRSRSILNETHHLLRVHHVNIIALLGVIAVDSTRGSVAIAMEYADNNLRSYIKCSPERIPEGQVKRLMCMLLHGLMHLHQKRIVHCDIKPANLLLMGDGTLKIGDFGMSRRKSSVAAAPGERIGTRGYVAPEASRGVKSYAPAIDMWAAGCVMAELVLKERAFVAGDDDELTRSHLFWARNKAQCQLPELSPPGFDLLCRLLEFVPTKRISAQDALSHPWFHGVGTLLPAQTPIHASPIDLHSSDDSEAFSIALQS